ncbi:MAG: hypothetical protein JWM84_3198 [Nocardioides sp.]|jgi:hypothetical protein|nr:hypothetical protein [Nocardioides sp.]
MSIHIDTDHPRIADGTFTAKPQGLPQIQLSHPTLPAFDPTFFRDRIGSSAGAHELEEGAVPFWHISQVRNAAQAVNDAYALENEIPGEAPANEWVDTKVYADGDFIVADIQHKDPTTAPYGSLVVFDKSGKTVGQYDNHTDEFGPRWEPMAGLRSQLFADLTESSNDGSLGDQL